MRPPANVVHAAAWLFALFSLGADPAFAVALEATTPTGKGGASPQASAARQRFREASSAAHSGQWQAALKLYRSAYALYPHATTLYNIGYCHGQLGEPTRALYYTSRALDPSAFEADRRLAPDREATARAFQQVLLGRVGSVTLSVSSKHPFFLKVDGVPPVPAGVGDGSFVPNPDASVATEDQVFVERVSLHLDPGPHEIVIDSDSGTYGRSIEVVAGQAVSIPWALESEPPANALPAPVPAAPEPAVTPFPSGASGPNANAGHGGEPGPYRSLAISSFVVGGAGLGLALVSGIVVLTTDNHLDSVCDGGDCPVEESEAVDRYRTAAQFTNVGLWTGAVGVALGAGFLLLDHADDRPGLSVVVEPSRVELQGTF